MVAWILSQLGRAEAKVELLAQNAGEDNEFCLLTVSVDSWGTQRGGALAR